MARLFGFIGNRPDLGPRVAAATASLLDVVTEGTPMGWGFGFYQGGEVLLRRRPLDERARIPLSEYLGQVRTDVLVGHARRATIGALRTDNTHPFRYRQWLFAHRGTVPGFEHVRRRLVESLPEFLRRSIRGETDSEIIFHLFLSFLHDRGMLNQQVVPVETVHGALRSSLSLLDRLCAEEGEGPAELNVLLSDGEMMLAHHGLGQMAVRHLAGQRDVEEVLGDEGLRQVRIPDMASCQLSLLVGDVTNPGVDFQPVPDGVMVTLTRQGAPRFDPR